MALFQRKHPIEKEWDKLKKQEGKLLAARAERKDTFLKQKLSLVVPEKLQDTLDAAFAKAFELIFDKGTSIIEKTYKKAKLEKKFETNQFAVELKNSKKNWNAFSKNAKQSGNINLLVSGTAGIGMGVIGVGIPDIPVFISMVLRSIYEIALNYGYHYDTPGEQYFILLLIEGAVACGDEMINTNTEIDTYINTKSLPATYSREAQIRRTSASLSKELLYMKFLQGVPIVGAVGGTYDVIYMKQIIEYANLKYKRRFFQAKRKELGYWEE